MRRNILPALVVLLGGCAAQVQPAADWDFSGESPWPAIRQERIERLLPGAMRRAGVDAWVTLLRENSNDPLALHVGGENAGAPAAVVFLLQAVDGADRVRSIMISGFGEAIALRELAVHDTVIVHDAARGGLFGELAAVLTAADPAHIAINSGPLAVADGLSATQRSALEEAVGPRLAARLVSSTPLVQEWLSVKLPAEVDVMRRAARLTARLQEEAYATVMPGRTRDLTSRCSCAAACVNLA